MTSEERGSQLFSEAIRSLEDGDPERAEQLFIGALNNLDKKHHLAILSLKSLVTITSNKGDFDAAIDWSLKLLESQTGALGHTHADVSRTVMNIATMCETLGKHEIAREVKELHQYASAAERAQKAQQVKNIRTTAKLVQTDDEPEEDEYDESVATFGEYWKRQKEQWRQSIENAGGVIIALVFLAAFGITAGALVGLKFCYSSDYGKTLSQPREQHDGTSRPSRWITADNRVEVQFATPSKVQIDVDGKKHEFGYNCYGYSPIEIGDLMVSLPSDKEYWLMINREGLTDENNRFFLHEYLPDRSVLAQISNVADMANRYYRKQKSYPDNVSEIGDFSYDNPYTLRRDYPLIQVVTVPGHSTPDAFLFSLRKGILWPGEPAMYPGCINIGHISHKTNMSVPETLVIHGCNRQGRFFTQSTGEPYYMVFEKGTQLEPRTSKLVFLHDVSKVCVLDVAPAFAGLLFFLIKARFVIFFGILFAVSYMIAGFFAEDATKRVAFGFGTVYLIIALISIYFGWFW